MLHYQVLIEKCRACLRLVGCVQMLNMKYLVAFKTYLSGRDVLLRLADDEISSFAEVVKLLLCTASWYLFIRWGCLTGCWIL